MYANDPWKVYEDEAARMRGNLAYGTTKDPDQYAKDLKTAKQVQAPMDVLQDPKLRPVIEDLAKKLSVSPDALLQRAPKTSSWIAESPDHAAVAHDDLDTLQEIEDASQRIPSGMTLGRRQALIEDRIRTGRQHQGVSEFENIFNRLAIPIPSMAMGWLETLASVPSFAGEVVKETQNMLMGQSFDQTAGRIAEAAKNPYREGSSGASVKAGFDWMRRSFASQTRESVSEFLMDPETGQQFKNPDYDPWFGRPAADALLSVPGTMAAFAVSGKVAGPNFAPTMASVTAGREKYQQALERGDSVGSALEQGTITGMLNQALMTALPHPVQTKTVAGTVGQATGRGVTLTLGMTAAENTAENLIRGTSIPWYHGADKQLPTFLGFELGGALPRMIEAASTSKLKARSPELFRKSLETVLKDSGAENVLIPAEDWKNWVLLQGADPAEYGDRVGASNIREALNAGTDVVIPTGDFLTRLSPEEQRSLIPDLKTRQDQMTAREHKAWVEAGGPEKLRELTKAPEQETPEYLTLKEEIRRKYLESGERPELADDYATLEANAYSNLAREAGMNPLELYQLKSPKVVVGEVPTTLGVEANRAAGLPRGDAGGEASRGGALPEANERYPSGGRIGSDPSVQTLLRAADGASLAGIPHLFYGAVPGTLDGAERVGPLAESVGSVSGLGISARGFDGGHVEVSAGDGNAHLTGTIRGNKFMVGSMSGGEHAGSGVGVDMYRALGEYLTANHPEVDGIVGLAGGTKDNPEGIRRVRNSFDGTQWEGNWAYTPVESLAKGPVNRGEVMQHGQGQGQEGRQVLGAEGGAHAPSDPLLQTNEDRKGVSAHVLQVERAVRELAKRSALSTDEKAAIKADAEKHGLDIKEMETRARETKMQFPAADGWARLEIAGIDYKEGKDGKAGKAELKWKAIPYSFDRAADGSALEPGTPEYQTRVDAIAKGMRDEVSKIYLRAMAGDQVAENILKQAGWYKEMRSRLRHEFGGLGDLFADLLGATSPNTPVRENWKNAVDVLRKASRGDFDKLIVEWEKKFSEIEAKENALADIFATKQAEGLTKKAINELPEVKAASEELSKLRGRESWDGLIPLKDSGAKYGFNGLNVARALVDLWRVVKNPNADIGRGETAPKALNFSGNLIGFRERATIDVWAARLLDRLAGRDRVPVPAETGVAGAMIQGGETKGQFRFGQDVFSKAVELIRSDKAMSSDERLLKINDDDLQAVAWFMEKELWTKKNWTSAAGEGGSFELEANLTGASAEDRARITELRKLIDSSVINQDKIRARQKIIDDKGINPETVKKLKAVIESKDSTEKDREKAEKDLERLENGAEAKVEKAKQEIAQLEQDAKDQKVKAQQELDDLHRTVDRYQAGLSVQQSAETQGTDYTPTDGHQAVVQQALRRAIYEGTPADLVLASKVVSTLGRYMGQAERSIDLEVVARDGFDASNLHLEVLRQALENRQHSTFLARVVRAEEQVDPTRHRPGVEIYFRNKGTVAELQQMLDKLHADMPFYTVIMDGRPTPETRAGQEGDVVGVRVMYMPEFLENFDGLRGLAPEEIGRRMKGKAGDLADLAEKIASENPEVTSALRLWYDAEVTFADKYQEKIDDIANRNAGRGDREARGQAWSGLEIASSLEDAARFLEAPGGAPGGGDPNGEPGAVRGGDAGVPGGEVGPLLQGNATRAGGWFRVLPDGTFEIGKTKFGNLYTFIHEPAHSYLYLIGELAGREGASEQLRADASTILRELGAESFESLTREQHETWTRWNENYLMAGKAPTQGLARVFQRFAIWARGIFSQARRQGVEFSPEIQGVFDRLYAGDRAMEQAQAVVDLKPMFATAEDMGVSQAEFDLYAKRAGKAVDSAREAVMSRLQEEHQARLTAAYAEARKATREQVAAEVEDEPAYRAAAALREGDLRLSRQAVLEQFGEEMLRRLPHGLRDSKGEGTLDPDAAAEILGFQSGRELIEALAGMEKKGDRIERLTDERMKETHGDLASGSQLTERAIEDLHNESRAEMLHAELQALRRKAVDVRAGQDLERRQQRAQAADERRQSREALQVPSQAEFRAAAADRVAEQTVRSLEPYSYLLASRREAQRSERALLAKDWATAGDAKQKELLNHHLFLEATKAKAQAEKIAEYGRRVNDPKFMGMLGKAGGDFQAQWLALADRYSFDRISYKALDAQKLMDELEKHQTLEAWAAQHVDDGAEIDPSLFRESPRNWREVPITELRAVYDALRNIARVARNQYQIDLDGKRIEFDQAVEEMVKSATEAHTQKTVPATGSKLSVKEKAVLRLQGWDAMMSKMDRILDHLGGTDINSPWRRYIKDTIDNASGREKQLSYEVVSKIRAAVEARGKDEFKRDQETIGVRLPRMERDMTRAQAISWVLNLGTVENRKVALLGEGLMDGEGTVSPVVDQILQKLSAKDYAFIQAVWDSLATLRPEIAEKERRVTGLEPKWKELTPFSVQTSDGQTVSLEGGYYPLKSDPLSPRFGKLFEPKVAAEGSFVRPGTSRGHTKKVTGATYPLLLDYQSVLGSHLKNVIKDVTMGEAISAVYKLIADPRIERVIQESIGPKAEAEFLPWLQAVAGMESENVQRNELVNWLMQRRTGMVMASLAGNLTSYLVQVGDALKPWTQLPAKDLARAFLDIRRNPKEMIEFIRELSPNEMRFREANFHRDLKDMLDSRGALEEKKHVVGEFLMEGFAVMDRFSSFPAWLASYRRGMDAHGNQEQAVREADRLIGETMQAGEARNMSRLMRQQGLLRLFTTFGGDANTWYGILSSAVKTKQLKPISVALMAAFMDSLLVNVIKGRVPQKDDEWGSWMLELELQSLFNPLGFLGDLGQGVVDTVAGKRVEMKNPVLGTFKKLFMDLPAAASSWKAGNKDDQELAMSAVDAVGTWAGIPGTAQVLKTWRYEHGIATGKYPEPETAVGHAARLAVGPPPKEKP